MANCLAGQTVLVTRPEHQAQQLCQLIEQAGGKAVLFPTLKIQWLSNDAALSCAVQQLSTADFAIFLSANAVIASACLIRQRWPVLPPQLRVIAIGKGTRSALIEHGLPVSVMPDDASSEGVLALPELQQLSRRAIIIFKGEGGRGVLTESFIARGAQVCEATCYRRVRPQTNISVLLPEWKKMPVNIIIITSCESLENLFSLIPDHKWLCSLRFIFMSVRVAARARQLGINNYTVAATASDAGILDALNTCV